MRVLLDHEQGPEWWALCRGMLGEPMTPVEDYMMATAPGQAGRVCVFEVEDDHPLATWVRIKHPEWIEPVWVRRAMKGQE